MLVANKQLLLRTCETCKANDFYRKKITEIFQSLHHKGVLKGKNDVAAPPSTVGSCSNIPKCIARNE